jgi:hypothetical protein
VLLAVGAVLMVSVGGASAHSKPKPSKTLYSSTSSAVSIPSVGVEAYSFNQVGNEVILNRTATTKSVTVTMVDWACQTGDEAGTSGPCTTGGHATFPTRITLDLYKASSKNASTGETTPGAPIKSVSKTFKIKYRPSADGVSGDGTCTGGEFTGSDGKCHNGLSQAITFTVNKKLPTDVVWGVSYSSDNSGPNPIGGTNSPQDSLNVGLAPVVKTGLDRAPDSIFWDTRYQGFTCADPVSGNTGPFVTGEFNRDGSCDGTPNSWNGYVPAAAFTAS